MCSPRNTGNINFSLWLTGGLSQGCPDFQKVYVFKVYVPFPCPTTTKGFLKKSDRKLWSEFCALILARHRTSFKHRTNGLTSRMQRSAERGAVGNVVCRGYHGFPEILRFAVFWKGWIQRCHLVISVVPCLPVFFMNYPFPNYYPLPHSKC